MTDVIQLGNAARRILEDDTIQSVFASMEVQYVGEWKSATVPEAREAAWYRVKALADIQTGLRRLRDSGTRAQRTA